MKKRAFIGTIFWIFFFFILTTFAIFYFKVIYNPNTILNPNDKEKSDDTISTEQANYSVSNISIDPINTSFFNYSNSSVYYNLSTE